MAHDAADSKPKLTIMIFGDAGSGKSTLAEAIIKVQAKKGLAKPDATTDIVKKRSKSYDDKVVVGKQYEFASDQRRYVLFDYAAHKDFARDLLTRATPFDGAIMVEGSHRGSSNDKKAFEQFRLAMRAGVRHIVAYINGSSDDDEMLAMSEMEARHAFTKNGLDGENAIAVRGVDLHLNDDIGRWEPSIVKLLEELDRHIPEPRGEASTEVSAAKHAQFEADIYVYEKEEGGRHTPFFSNLRVLLHLGATGATEATGTLKLSEKREREDHMLMPGGYDAMTIMLDKPVALRELLPFTVREVGGGPIIGAGRVNRIFK